jgi:hypothetical protein
MENFLTFESEALNTTTTFPVEREDSRPCVHGAHHMPMIRMETEISVSHPCDESPRHLSCRKCGENDVLVFFHSHELATARTKHHLSEVRLYGGWHRGRLTDALLDRPTHRVYILEANGKSFRHRDSR